MSMYQNFQGLSTVVLFLVLALGTNSCENSSSQKTIPGPNDKIYTVETASVFEEEIPDILLVKGRFQPSLETEVKSPLTGKIQELNVQMGQNVVGGENILRIQNERLPYVLERQRAELREAEAELEYLSRSGNFYEDEYLNNREVEYPEESERDNYADEDAYPEEEEAYDENEESFNMQGGSDLRDRLREIIQRRDQENTDNERSEAEKEEIQESRQGLQQAKIDRIQSEINLTEKQIENSTLNAPFNGFISKVEVAQGQNIEEGQVLYKIIKLDPIELTLEIPQEKAALIKSQTTVKITVPLIQKKIYEGYISFISPRVNPDTQSLPLKISVNNYDQKIKAEMEGEAQIILSDSKHLARLVPQSAIIYHENKAHVYTINGQIAMRRPVKLGSAYREWIEITEGVNLDDRVVSQGADQLRDKEEFIKVR